MSPDTYRLRLQRRSKARWAGALAALLLLVVATPAQERSPFSSLDHMVAEQAGGWDGDKESLSRIFNDERVRLGPRFEPELLKYLGAETEKHYWIASFLVTPSYLHGNKPLPQLALAIDEQAISLLAGKTGSEDVGRVVGLSVDAAVIAQSLGISRAASHKEEAERIMSGNQNFRAWFPAMDEYEQCLYESIGKPAVPCERRPAPGTPPLPTILVSSGALEARIIDKPAPAYPAEAREKGLSGEVQVEVLIDENGKVERATALGASTILQQAAVTAAYRAQFRPMKVGGRPAKVHGVLTYRFVK